MNNRKKMLVLAMFVLMATGCGVYHTNIIKNISGKSVLVTDTETKKERIIEFVGTDFNNYLLEYARPGDTILIRMPRYEENLVLTPGFRTNVCFLNYDSINERARNTYFETKKQELFNERTR